MRLNMSVQINEDLTVKFEVLQLVLTVLNSLRRAYVEGHAAGAGTERPYGPLDYNEAQPGQFKIALIKAVRYIPCCNFDLRDSKNIVEFALENRPEIERISGL